MKNLLVRDKWLVGVEPRSYPRFYKIGSNAPRSMESPRHAVSWDTPLPPGCRLRYHNAAFGLSVQPPIPQLQGWSAWRTGASLTVGRDGATYTLVLRGGIR